MSDQLNKRGYKVNDFYVVAKNKEGSRGRKLSRRVHLGYKIVFKMGRYFLWLVRKTGQLNTVRYVHYSNLQANSTVCRKAATSLRDHIPHEQKKHRKSDALFVGAENGT